MRAVLYYVAINSGILVPPPGLEPGRLAARDFKSLVSTYSTMEANWPALQDSNLRPTA
jgi:hypothetical protein